RPALPAGTRVLYRFGTQSWERVAIVDDALLPREGRWSLGMLDARPMLAAVDRHRVRVILLDSDHRQFSPLPPIENVSPVRIRLLEGARPSLHVQASDRDTLHVVVGDDWQSVMLEPD
ncbi:MAG TPA: hypothetical protein PKB10_14385, partial [Tepidisphaeraceae bacterium]|nr:hypothetical protein [Tepidisphaeraceae bacterium]